MSYGVFPRMRIRAPYWRDEDWLMSIQNILLFSIYYFFSFAVESFSLSLEIQLFQFRSPAAVKPRAGEFFPITFTFVLQRFPKENRRSRFPKEKEKLIKDKKDQSFLIKAP